MTPTIRNATRDELDVILDWAAREGWNPGLDDAGPFWAADPRGYHVATVDGELAAAVSVVKYDPAYAFLGFYMARPEYRGRGIGWALWQAAIASAGARTIGLDGVVAQQNNYRKSGFAYAHANVRYGGDVSFAAPDDPRLVHVAPVHLPLLSAYDRALSPAPREDFLAEWLRTGESRRSIALLRDGRVGGFGTIRACREGFKIGPLFSDTSVGADLLFRALVADVGGGRVFLDIPEPNTEARALCARYNLTPVFETARMYRGTDPQLPLGRIFGITTFELG
ncbi:GNAT family N-acetyltransferase [Sinorhizobium sp. BG8]|uniref:GNAT family N-acetyltransferase n=1 Tax=Sinorhizobium sp. BG8 TaxID=2613773 RepID=UPI00193D0FD5|nr:GNAT family N-acetyltransferase [Sinorhizobium sp. BG8]QRM54889.1 GNAT family N-acetyltransferase [Sinorhizobium sp. BG8]